MDKDKIKHFQTELKAILGEDPIYRSIYRTFSKELKLYEPFDAQQSDLEETNKSLFLERLNKMERRYQVLYDKYNRAYNKIVEKNTQEIKLQHRLLISNNREIQAKYQHILSQIESDRIKLREQIESQIADASSHMQRELFSLGQIYKKNRAENLNIIDEIEKEHKMTEEAMNANFEKQKQALIDQFNDINKVKSDAIDNNKSLQEALINENNLKYIDIKKTFNDVNVTINKKISQLSKSYHQAVGKLDKSVEKLNEPVYENIQVLKNNYQDKVETIKTKYANDLALYDNQFEETTTQYQNKREKLILEHGESISIYNSKLANNREQFELNKSEVIKDYRDKMKDSSEHMQSRLGRDMKTETKALDKDFNRLIIRTQNDIFKMKQKFQQDLTTEENKFLTKRYEWRLNKLLLTNQYHQSLKKLELNFRYNLEFENAKIALNNNQKTSKHEILTYTLDQDDLPLETQISLQNLVQERELSLLNNDQQIALNEFKIEILNIEHAYDLAHQELNYLEEKSKLDLEAEMLVINSNVQLELEKAKIKREEFQKDYDLRSILAQSVFERQSTQHDYKYEQQNIDWHYQEEVAQIQMNDHKFLVSRHETMIYQKRTTFMRRADLKTKSRIQQNEALKAIKHYELDVELEQFYVEQLVESLIFAYQRVLVINDLIDTLFHLPAHPDIFRKSMDLFQDYIAEIHLLVDDAVEKKKQVLFAYLEKQVSDINHYKHALRHETFQFFNQNNIDQFNIDIKHLEEEIKSLEATILSEQAILEKHHNFIQQLLKINEGYDKDDFEHKSLIKENDQLIKRHEYIIEAVSKRIKTYEDQITRYHRAINRLSFKKQRMTRKMRFEDFNFKRRLKKDTKVYAIYENYFKKVFKQININFNIFDDAFGKFNQYIQEHMYLSENQMKDAQSNFLKKADAFSDYIMIEQQKQLKLIKRYYRVHLDKEAVLIQDIKANEKRSMKLLSDSAHIFTKEVEIFLEQQRKLVEHMLVSAKRNQKNESILAAKSYTAKSRSLDFAITEQENSISRLSKEIESEINSINQNQHEIALQYSNDSQDKIHALRDQHEKHIKSLESLNQKRIDDMKNLNDHLDKKNQVLLSKFSDQEKQINESHDQKLTHIKQKISDAYKAIDDAQLDYKKDLRQSIRKRDSAFRELNSDLKSKNKLTTKTEQKILKNDLNEEKQSYKFKIKSLHLDKKV